MSVNVLLPGTERKIIYVRMPPDGDPKPCYEDALGYAKGCGYVECDAPGSIPKLPANVVAPDETEKDRDEQKALEQNEREEAVRLELMNLGITRMANANCLECDGAGVPLRGDAVPCRSCFPEAYDARPSTTDAPDIPGGGEDNEGSIVGAPDDDGIAPASPPRCSAKVCKGLCGICPPPEKMTVREGRELNRNRRAAGKEPLRIEGGVVQPEG